EKKLKNFLKSFCGPADIGYSRTSFPGREGPARWSAVLCASGLWPWGEGVNDENRAIKWNRQCRASAVGQPSRFLSNGRHGGAARDGGHESGAALGSGLYLVAGRNRGAAGRSRARTARYPARAGRISASNCYIRGIPPQ